MRSAQQQAPCCSCGAPDSAGPSLRPYLQGARCRKASSSDSTSQGSMFESRSRSLTSMLLIALLGFQIQFCTAVTPLTDWKPGIATNYGGPKDGKNPYDPSWGTLVGSCGYGKLDKSAWPYWSVAALSSSSPFVTSGPIDACGECFEVKCVDTAPFQGRCITGSNQVSVIVQITDICPECQADQMDIQALTYNKLSPMETGRISIMYRRVQCVPPKPMDIYVDNNGGQGSWLRLFVEQAGGDASVKQVQVRTSGSQEQFQDLTNKWGSDWEMPNAPAFPLDINIVGADGESVTAYQVIQNGGATGKMATTVQFKIANPADQALTESVNGDGSSTASAGARGDSLSPGPAAAPGASGPSTGGCTDVPPSSTFTCQQQKDFNACSQPWMTAGNFCQQTCGRCGGGSASPSSSPGGSPSWSPSPSSSWSPSNSPSSWSPSNSPSWSPSPSWTPSNSPSSWSPSNSPSTWSPSNSPSWSPSPSWTPSNSPSSWSPSPSWSPSNSPSSWSPSNSPSWSSSNSPSSWSPSKSPSWSPSGSPYASGGRKLLAPAMEADMGQRES